MDAYPVFETVDPADLVVTDGEHAHNPLLDIGYLDDLFGLHEMANNSALWTGVVEDTDVLDDTPRPPVFWDYENIAQTPKLDHSIDQREHTSGIQTLLNEFGRHNINRSQADGVERPSISSDASDPSLEHGHTTLGRDPKDQSIPPSRPRRGRLLADMSYDGPEPVFEDSDSHHSWTAADNLEGWCNHLRERLSEFRTRRERVSIITSRLQTRQRRKIHSMANLWGLSHMSLGSGREKRVLICKCELTRTFTPAHSSLGKPWNPARHNWAPGLVDPRIVLFDSVSSKLTAARLRECLQAAGLPAPCKITIDSFNSPKAGMSHAVATAYAMFDNAYDATVVLLALDSTKPNWNGLDVELECDYVHFPQGFELNDATLASFDTLPQAIRMEKLRLQEAKTFSSFRSRHGNSALYSPSDSEEDSCDYLGTSPAQSLASMASNTSRKTSLSSSLYRDPGYASASSNRSAVGSDCGSQASASKKRKRVPKITGGFTCTWQGCERIFDRDGDRRKHEKVHTERTHKCEKCGKGFLYPKDLRRHMIVHSIHVSDMPSSEEAGETSSPETVPPPKQGAKSPSSGSPPLREDDLRRLYSEARLDRHISRLPASFG